MRACGDIKAARGGTGNPKRYETYRDPKYTKAVRNSPHSQSDTRRVAIQNIRKRHEGVPQYEIYQSGERLAALQ